MSREIKFRVWDKVFNNFEDGDKSWEDVDEFYLTPRKLLEASIRNLEPERYIIQQFTGFQDKNGKEIYEGDIVSFSEHFAASALYSVPDQIVADKWIKKYSEVKFYNGSWVISPERFSTLIGRQSKLAEVISQEVEVAGNIFENQELLKNV